MIQQQSFGSSEALYEHCGIYMQCRIYRLMCGFPVDKIQMYLQMIHAYIESLHVHVHVCTLAHIEYTCIFSHACIFVYMLLYFTETPKPKETAV